MSTSRFSYVYKSIREGDRVRRIFLGTLGDPVVQTLLESERLSKATREAEQRKVERELVLVKTIDDCLQLIHMSNNQAVRNLRKRWRRAHNAKVRRDKMPEPRVNHDFYEALVADAADGDVGALAELRQLLKEKPQLRYVLGDLSNHVQLYLVDLAAGGAIDVKESLAQTLKAKRDELLKGGDSLPEQLLVDQVLNTMLDAAVCQLGFSQPHPKESIALRWERRLTAAQARHQAAIKSLIEVRQMLDVHTASRKPQ